MNNKLKMTIVILILGALMSCERSISHPLYVEGGGVFDFENNFYKTVIIGNQEWLAENLKTDLFSNGDSIPYSGTDIRVKVYNDDPANEGVFGKLYNYQAVLDTSSLCPCGWHIPTELEYGMLINYLGGYENAMKEMKSTGSIEKGDGLWTNPEDDSKIRGNNNGGFNALPAGIGFYNNYLYKDSITTFWSLPSQGTDAIEYSIGINVPYISKQRNTLAQAKEVLYYSVRCIKNL